VKRELEIQISLIVFGVYKKSNKISTKVICTTHLAETQKGLAGTASFRATGILGNTAFNTL